MPKETSPERFDSAGNSILQRGRSTNKDFDYSGLNIDGQERITFTEDSFSQGPEYEFDEFH